MNTLAKYAGQPNIGTLELFGLSTDEKPIGMYEGKYITNGSLFLEIDTGIVSIYDEENQQWIYGG